MKHTIVHDTKCYLLNRAYIHADGSDKDKGCGHDRHEDQSKKWKSKYLTITKLTLYSVYWVKRKEKRICGEQLIPTIHATFQQLHCHHHLFTI